MKQFSPTPEMIAAAETCFAAMAYTQTVAPVIEAIQQKVLDANKYAWDFESVSGGVENPKRDFAEFVAKHGEYCSREFDTYLIGDANLSHYIDECHKEYLLAGFDVKHGYCPKLIAESLERDAKRALIDALQPITGVTSEMATRSLKRYREFVELSLRLMAPFCGDSKTILKSLQTA